MNVTIYADTLVFLNVFVTYFLLRTTQLLCKRPLRRARMLFASVLGGCYALTLLLRPFPLALSLTVRAAVCVLLCVSAFSFVSLHVLVKTVAVFLLVNGLFAGCMFACQTVFPQITYSSGVVYFDVGVPFLVLSTLAIYALIRLVTAFFDLRSSGSKLAQVTVRIGGQSFCGTGLFDTGHQLADPFTGKPVLIVRPHFLQSVFPPKVSEFMDGKDAMLSDVPDEWRGRLRLFPYNSLGGNGLLPAFRSDSVTVRRTQCACTKEDLYIAVAPRQLAHGEYDVLIPAAILDEITEGEQIHAAPSVRTENASASRAAALFAKARGVLHQRSANASGASEKTGGSGRARTASVRRRNGP